MFQINFGWSIFGSKEKCSDSLVLQSLTFADLYKAVEDKFAGTSFVMPSKPHFIYYDDEGMHNIEEDGSLSVEHKIWLKDVELAVNVDATVKGNLQKNSTVPEVDTAEDAECYDMLDQSAPSQNADHDDDAINTETALDIDVDKGVSPLSSSLREKEQCRALFLPEIDAEIVNDEFCTKDKKVPMANENVVEEKSPEMKSLMNAEKTMDNPAQSDGGNAKENWLQRLSDARIRKMVNEQGGRLETEESLRLLLSLIPSCWGQEVNSVRSNINAVLLIGNTGVGKSTTINALMGFRMRKNVTGDVVVEEGTSGYKTAKIGHDILESETLTAHGFVPLARDRAQWTLVDCPGFCDTRGWEFDVANAVNMKDSLRLGSAGVRFVLIVTSSSLIESKGGTMKSLLEYFEKLFCQDAIKSMLILVTKTAEGQLGEKQFETGKKIVQMFIDKSRSRSFDSPEFSKDAYPLMMRFDPTNAAACQSVWQSIDSLNADKNVFLRYRPLLPADTAQHLEEVLELAFDKSCSNSSGHVNLDPTLLQKMSDLMSLFRVVEKLSSLHIPTAENTFLKMIRHIKSLVRHHNEWILNMSVSSEDQKIEHCYKVKVHLIIQLHAILQKPLAMSDKAHVSVKSNGDIQEDADQLSLNDEALLEKLKANEQQCQREILTKILAKMQLAVDALQQTESWRQSRQFDAGNGDSYTFATALIATGVPLLAAHHGNNCEVLKQTLQLLASPHFVDFAQLSNPIAQLREAIDAFYAWDKRVNDIYMFPNSDLATEKFKEICGVLLRNIDNDLYRILLASVTRLIQKWIQESKVKDSLSSPYVKLNELANNLVLQDDVPEFCETLKLQPNLVQLLCNFATLSQKVNVDPHEVLSSEESVAHVIFSPRQSVCLVQKSGKAKLVTLKKGEQNGWFLEKFSGVEVGANENLVVLKVQKTQILNPGHVRPIRFIKVSSNDKKGWVADWMVKPVPTLNLKVHANLETYNAFKNFTLLMSSARCIRFVLESADMSRILSMGSNFMKWLQPLHDNHVSSTKCEDFPSHEYMDLISKLNTLVALALGEIQIAFQNHRKLEFLMKINMLGSILKFMSFKQEYFEASQTRIAETCSCVSLAIKKMVSEDTPMEIRAWLSITHYVDGDLSRIADLKTCHSCLQQLKTDSCLRVAFPKDAARWKSNLEKSSLAVIEECCYLPKEAFSDAAHEFLPKQQQSRVRVFEDGEDLAILLIKINVLRDFLEDAGPEIDACCDNLLKGQRAEIVDVSGLVITSYKKHAELGNYASKLLVTVPHFRKIYIKMLNQKAHGVKFVNTNPKEQTADVLSGLKGRNSKESAASFEILSRSSKTELTATYNKFMEEFSKLMQHVISRDPCIEQTIISCAKESIKAIKSSKSFLSSLKTYFFGPDDSTKENISFNDENQGHVAKLLACIFSANAYIDGSSEEGCYLQPHPTQLACIFRLLCVDSGECRNHLAEVGTGEGKSVVLSAISAFFAFLDYRVDVACYNPYLTSRDKAASDALLNFFNLKAQVRYCTVDGLMDNFVEDGNLPDLRACVLSMLKGNPYSFMGGMQRKTKKVLLIDEVDVFFGEDFFGHLQESGLILEDEESQFLVSHAFNNRISFNSSCVDLAVENLLQMPQAKSLQDKYPCLRLDLHLREMMADLSLQDFPISGPLGQGQHLIFPVKEFDDIGELDSNTSQINRDVIRGYRTFFAYLHHCRVSMSIDESKRSRSYGIVINCGGMLYSDIPRFCDIVMGVSGTVSSLSAGDLKVLEEYNFQYQTIVPSTFKKQPLLQWPFNVIVGPKEAYFDEIIAEIKSVWTIELKGKRALRRPILIVLKDQPSLETFSHYLRAKEMANPVVHGTPESLTEDLTDASRAAIISRATGEGKLTLMTRSFGRGTDFICSSADVNSAGGVHVIMTFLPELTSELVQIKGRTCRQDNNGSFHAICWINDLEDVGFCTAKEFQDEFSKMKHPDLEVGKFIEKMHQAHDRGRTQRMILNRDRNREYQGHTYEMVRTASAGNEEGALELLYGSKIGGGCGIHFSKTAPQFHHIFLLDQSGSMKGERWNCLKDAFESYLKLRLDSQYLDVVTVIKFSSGACHQKSSESHEKDILVECNVREAVNEKENLICDGGGTFFSPAFSKCLDIVKNMKSSNAAVILMTDGENEDGIEYTKIAAKINTTFREKFPDKTILFFAIPMQSSQADFTLLQEKCGADIVRGDIAESFKTVARKVVVRRRHDAQLEAET